MKCIYNTITEQTFEMSRRFFSASSLTVNSSALLAPTSESGAGSCGEGLGFRRCLAAAAVRGGGCTGTSWMLSVAAFRREEGRRVLYPTSFPLPPTPFMVPLKGTLPESKEYVSKVG